MSAVAMNTCCFWNSVVAVSKPSVATGGDVVASVAAGMGRDTGDEKEPDAEARSDSEAGVSLLLDG